MGKVERKEETALDIEDAKEELEAEKGNVSIEKAEKIEKDAEIEETVLTEEEPATNEEKDSGQTDEAPADKNDIDEGTSAEELELNPDEAEEVFPTEEIKLERI